METLTKPAPESKPDLLELEDLRGLSYHDQFESIKKQLFGDGLEKTGQAWVDEELDFVDQTLDSLEREMLVKVSCQLGSNEGGWYENSLTGERSYLKFYKDPDQARIEFLADEIYKELGVKAAPSELVEVDGRLAIASAEVIGAEDAYPQEMAASPDVRAGFVADAYLANYDVVGLCYDNIVANPDGYWRIDNGGSMTFRARGRLKDYPADDVPELRTMLDHETTAGQVFGDLTEAEMAGQARHLVEALQPELLEDLVFNRAGLDGEVAETVYEGLIGRRQFLAERFGPPKSELPAPSRSRVRDLVEKIDQRRESASQNPETQKIRTREFLIADEDHIEDQLISVIDARDRGCLEVNFKLTADHYQKIIDQIQAQIEQPDQDNLLAKAVKNGHITYYNFSSGCEPIINAEAFVLDHGGLQVKIAKPAEGPAQNPYHKGTARSFLGMVSFDIACERDSNIEPQQIESRLDDILVNLLDVPGGVNEPGPEAEKNYKIARYAWCHRLDSEVVARDYDQDIDYLERRDVFSSYSTIVHEGVYQYYEQRYGEYAVSHYCSPQQVVNILTNGGLMSSQERFRRGLGVEGLSTFDDFDTGGSDQVFCQTTVEADTELLRGGNLDPDKCYIVMDPSVFDRTDWYSYPCDYYGSTEAKFFNHRQAPMELLADLKRKGSGQFEVQNENEQMFKTGIGNHYFRGFVCQRQTYDLRCLTQTLLNRLLPDPKQQSELYREKAVQKFLDQRCGQLDTINQIWDQGPQAVRDFLNSYGIETVETGSGPKPVDAWLEGNLRMQTIDRLRRAGWEEINGQPVEQFVSEADSRLDFVDISHGRQARSRAAEGAEEYGAYDKPYIPKANQHQPIDGLD